jgi:hypothetical protein
LPLPRSRYRLQRKTIADLARPFVDVDQKDPPQNEMRRGSAPAREMLAGKPVSVFMTPNPITVPSTLALDELVEGYIHRHHHERFPFIDASAIWLWLTEATM